MRKQTFFVAAAKTRKSAATHYIIIKRPATLLVTGHFHLWFMIVIYHLSLSFSICALGARGSIFHFSFSHFSLPFASANGCVCAQRGEQCGDDRNHDLRHFLQCFLSRIFHNILFFFEPRISRIITNFSLHLVVLILSNFTNWGGTLRRCRMPTSREMECILLGLGCVLLIGNFWLPSKAAEPFAL